MLDRDDGAATEDTSIPGQLDLEIRTTNLLVRRRPGSTAAPKIVKEVKNDW